MKTLYQVEMWDKKLGQWVQVDQNESKDACLNFIPLGGPGEYRIHEVFVVE
jgi:hypothetical protein